MQVVGAEVQEEDEFEGSGEGGDHAGLDGQAHDADEELVGRALAGGGFAEEVAHGDGDDEVGKSGAAEPDGSRGEEAGDLGDVVQDSELTTERKWTAGKTEWERDIPRYRRS